jgi:hypothetical protein
LAAVRTLARFSVAFLLLRAENVGLAVTWVPAILMVMNIVHAASAYPLADRAARHRLALDQGTLTSKHYDSATSAR